MRRMSFALTERQLLDRTKTVTRRLGWRNLYVGEQLVAVNKCMGLKKGEKSRELARIRVLAIDIEPLNKCDDDDAMSEGFPEMTGEEFVTMFCKAMRCIPDTVVTRIWFEVVS